LGFSAYYKAYYRSIDYHLDLWPELGGIIPSSVSVGMLKGAGEYGVDLE